MARDLYESWWEACCESCQYQLRNLPIKRVAADPMGTNAPCPQTPLSCHQRWSKQKRLKAHLIHLVGNFDSKLISFFREKFWHNTFLRNLVPVNEWDGETKEKRVGISKGLTEKE